MERVVIVGAGLAGLRTAEELRARDFSGDVIMIGAERYPPYDRPPLTKKFMTGEVDDTTLPADLTALGVEARLGETVTGLTVDAAGGDGRSGGGVVRTAQGEYAYRDLVVATGAAPVALPGAGRQRFLRTIDDARELRSSLRPGLRLVVVGAGWIGAELATAAARRGCRVTVVEGGAAPLAAVLGPEVGSRTAPWYEAAGVDLRVGQAVASVEHGGLVLAGGGWLPADEVVTAVGVRPQVGWLASAGLICGDGVAVDEGLRASVPGVYAAGDAAAFLSRRYGRRLRVEHWDNALHAPEVVAANILGGDAVYDPVPYFWSEQFGRMVQYAGHHGGADRLVWRGEPADQEWSVCWLAGDPAGEIRARGSLPQGPRSADGEQRGPGGVRGAAARGSDGERLVAVLAVGRPRDLLQGRRLIASGSGVDPSRLADPSIPLRDAGRGGAAGSE